MPAAIVFVAGMTTGGEVLLLALGVRIHALPALLGAAFAAAFLLLAWVVSNLMPRTHDILAVCAYCRKVLEQGCSWLPFEEYMLRHFNVRCSHGICPDCVSKQVPDRDREETSVTPRTAPTKERSITS